MNLATTSPEYSTWCPSCGRAVGRDAKGRPRKYCSWQCVGRAVGLQGDARIRNPPAQVNCASCGKTFHTYHRNKKYCDKECMKKFWKKSGMKHPGGGGGKDINHNAIADVFKSVGAVVVDTSMVGGGFADMLVIFRGTVHVVEIKNPNTAYGRAGLNKNQKKFHDSVKHQGGQIHIVSTEDEALAIIGATRTA